MVEYLPSPEVATNISCLYLSEMKKKKTVLLHEQKVFKKKIKRNALKANLIDLSINA